ncbi:MAG: NADH-quinone oxidoreductase subunit NuoF [Spirochaetes bacterium]|nr:MAG: NADH-quinone oxidoreductase subunit NuoF [Spirochaetota bacterium]
MEKYRSHIMLCTGTGCVSNGAFDIKNALERELRRHKLENEVLIVTTGCNGFCERGPIVVVHPGEIFYQRLKPEDIPYLVEEHFLKGRPVKKFMYIPSDEKPPIPVMSEIEFFKHQRLIVLRNRGLIDPENINEYIANDGYTALEKALIDMTPEQIIEEVKTSGLRGRGGAGFPTGLKWELCRKADGNTKYIICNGDEGDPGAFMDRSILESDPHSVIEGMIIGSIAIGAESGFIYVRNEYPIAVQRISKAINDAKKYGILGKNILGTDKNFDINVVQGGGAFVCGEETALIASIEGAPGRPRQRPPFPVEKGLWGKPTNINNVETWANIPMIIQRGGKWFSEIGTKTSKGTKVFSLVGKVNNTGLVEVPMGITLKEIVFNIGGGIPRGKKLKAVQCGGPSGGCIPGDLINLPIDFEALTEAGAIMGSGGLIVMDEDTCMVDVAKYFVTFLADESCGKCLSCRDGLKRMKEILENITTGKGKDGDIELLEELSEVILEASMCGLGKTAANPVLSTLRYFRDEYKKHIYEKKCPAHVCKELVTYFIDPEKCTGCMVCLKKCPYNAIIGEKKEAHTIIQEKCAKCGTCYELCKFGAIVVN